MPKLILASTSRYRRECLERLRLPLETRNPDVDERAEPGETPDTLAARLARAKAESVSARTKDERAIVIGADQVAALDGELLRKPGNPEPALRQLLACQGRVVSFFTACTVIDNGTGRRWDGIDETRVRFLKLDARHLARYIELEEPLDCAGGFKAEGLGIVLFESIESTDPTGLLGLPLIWLSGVLREAGVDPLGVSNGG